MSLSIWWMLLFNHMVEFKLTNGYERVIITVPMFIRHAHHTKTVYKILEKPPEQPVLVDQIKMTQPQRVGPKNGPGPKAVEHVEHSDEIIHHHVHVGRVNHGHSQKSHSHQKRNRGHGRHQSDKHGHAHRHSGKQHGGNNKHGRKPKYNRGHGKHSDYKHGKDNRGHFDLRHGHKGKSHRDGDYNHKNKHRGGHEPREYKSEDGYKREVGGGDFRGGYQVVENEDTVDGVDFDNLLSTMPENMKSFLTSSQPPTDLQDGMSSVSAVSSTPATASKDVYYTLDPQLPYDVTRTSRQQGKPDGYFVRNRLE